MELHFDGIGAAFYPDQHPRRTWKPYIEKMAEAGISFVRLAEFAWDKLEPTEGNYDFAWLDEVLDMLAEKGIRAIMCTPGATPPVWMCEKYDFYPKTPSGKDSVFGTRRYVCPNAPDFLQKSWAITREMGRHYAKDPRVMAWQIDNEIGHPFCFCDRCKALFQKFMEDKFGTVENMNDTLGFHFWGQTLQRFDQLPMPTEFTHSSLWLNYHHFYSESVIHCFGTQADILREEGVDVPISTNTMMTWHGYDHVKLAKKFDYTTADYYFYDGFDIFGGDIHALAFANAYLRSFKQGPNPRYNEFRGGKTHDLVIPGEIRYHSLAAIALGADQIDYFRWDICPSGQERNNSGVVRTLTYPGRNFTEVKDLISEIAPIKEKLDGSALPPAQTALLYSYETQYDVAEYHQDYPEFAKRELAGNQYPALIAKQFKALMNIGENPDILFQDGDFSRYKVIICPACMIMTEKMAQQIREFVKNGGLFLMLPNTGVMDENGQACESGLPGPIADVMGTHSVDYGKIPRFAEEVTLESNKYGSFKVTDWMEELIVDPDTEVLGYYAGIPGLGVTPAFTCHPFGKGKAWHLGALPAAENELEDFYRKFYAENNIDVNGWTDGRTYCFKRVKPDGSSIAFEVTPSERKIAIKD